MACNGNLFAIRRYVLDFTPGSRYTYSNLNYSLLGMVLELAYEQAYRASV